MKRPVVLFSFLAVAFVMLSAFVDLTNLFNYANQPAPSYITRDNTGTNSITDEGATLGRVLFYDKQLSTNNSIACASCHHQEFAFGDTSVVSQGVNGVTGRHSMRLVNSRFASEAKFFWDERAIDLEAQTTMPIRDHIEMGYSGTNGAPDFQDLLNKMDTISYYNDLFYLAFGDTVITEARMQLAIAQFVRSIQSFDSPYDIGRNQTANDSVSFPNLSQNENLGKALFITNPVFNNNGSRISGGFGCASCHRPPEFDIDPNSRSNGVVFTPGSTGPNGGVDTVVFRSPSLRDVVNSSGVVNGRLMHTANFNTLTQVLNHYNSMNLFNGIPGVRQAIDTRLIPNGNGQQLNMTNQERNRVIAFLGTLTGVDMYTNPKWSNPFDTNGRLTITNSPLTSLPQITEEINFSVFPNPVTDNVTISGDIENKTIEIYSISGKRYFVTQTGNTSINISLEGLSKGTYIVSIKNKNGQFIATKKILKN